MNDRFEHFTDAELAEAAYLELLRAVDDIDDNEHVTQTTKMLAALWGRLRGPYCEIEGCHEPHVEHFPWCAKHLAEHDFSAAALSPERAETPGRSA